MLPPVIKIFQYKYIFLICLLINNYSPGITYLICEGTICFIIHKYTLRWVRWAQVDNCNTIIFFDYFCNA
jgi:hypothetical protein